MKQIVTTVLHDCLTQDFDSARRRLRELSPAELRELQLAAMALQNLTAARRYAVAQQHVVAVQRLQESNVAE
jgi:hypothetical protein